MTGANGVGRTNIGSAATTITGANDSAQVVGMNTSIGAFISGSNGVGQTALSSQLPPNSGPITAAAINNTGRVVGSSYTGSGPGALRVPYITGPNGVGSTQLTALGSNSGADAINGSGQVIGLINNSTTRTGYFTGTNGTGITFLGGPQDANFPTAINSSGKIIGQGWLYSAGAFTDLNALPDVQAAGWSNLYPTAINDAGQIVGGAAIGGEAHAFLLTRK